MLVRAPWSRGLEIPLESTIHVTVFSSLQNDTDLPKFGAVRRQVCEVTARLTASSTWRPEPQNAALLAQASLSPLGALAVHVEGPEASKAGS